MRKVSKIEIIENLKKWKNICELMENKRDSKIVDEIINLLDCNEKAEFNLINDIKISRKARCSNLDKVLEILEGVKGKNQSILIKHKLKFMKIDFNLESSWDSLEKNKKESLTKLELNVIYNILYKPNTIKYINKNKKEIINDIDYFLDDVKRDRALKASNLI